jgi:protease-4
VPTLFDVQALASELADDPRPGGLLVTLRSFEGGMATAMALRDLLLGVRKSGRHVVVHLPAGADTKAYLVATAASHVYCFPGAPIALLGFASRGVYVRQALEKAGVLAEVLARGRYKSAGESLTRDAMSDAQREQVGALLDRMHAALTASLRTARGLSEAQATAAIDRGIHRAPDAVSARLVDAPLFDDQVAAALPLPGGPPPPIVPATAYVRARLATKLGKHQGRPCIGVVRVHGPIVQGASVFSRGALEREVIGAVRAARDNRKVRGVILHIDSPGGSALASARMHREIELLASEKPLVAAMANVAASGGYYVAAPAHAIVAQPVSVTGSIGVVAARFALAPLLERLGVHVDTLKRGALADLFDVVRPWGDEDRAAVDRDLEGTYAEFVAIVARGRRKSLDEVEAMAQGRVWTGEDAQQRGLVDLLGGFDVALAEVRRRVGSAGDRLAPRVLRGRKDDSTTGAARPARAATILAEELLGEWLGLLPLAAGRERVLAWAPEAMGFR